MYPLPLKNLLVIPSSCCPSGFALLWPRLCHQAFFEVLRWLRPPRSRGHTHSNKKLVKIKVWGLLFSFRIFFRQTKILYDDDFLRQQQQLELYSTWLPNSSSPELTCLTTSATLLTSKTKHKLWTAAVQGLRDVISMYVMIGPARVEGRVGPCNAL